MKLIIIYACLIFSSILLSSCARSETPQTGGPAVITQIPIIYSSDYNITLGGIEKYHPFDTAKYKTVHDYLVEKGLVRADQFIAPPLVTDEELELVHSKKYLESLSDPLVAARVSEVNEVAYFPISTIEEGVYKPMKYATGGTILGARLALEKGAAINLSGGFHHAKAEVGSGFCFFSDIALAVRVLWKTRPELKVMILDLDAHQGNGYASIFKDDPRIFIFDMYNGDIFPHDEAAARYIDFSVKIKSGTDTDAYLALLHKELPPALKQARPDLVIYNAGTDIYKNDPLGQLAVSEEGIIKRDEFVFLHVRKTGLPVLMLLAGGYTKESGRIIARSIENLIRRSCAESVGSKTRSRRQRTG